MFWNEPGWVNSVSIVTRVWDGCSRVQILAWARDVLSKASGLALGNHPTTCLLGTLVISQGYGCCGMKLTTCCYPLLRLILWGSIPLLTSMCSWKVRGQLCLLLIFWMKSKRIRWAGHVAHMGEDKRNADRVLVGKHEGKRLHGRPRLGQEEDVKVNLQEIGPEVVYWSHLAQI